MLGAIEAGGTKFVCAVGDEHGNIHERAVFPTTTPEETMAHVIDFSVRTASRRSASGRSVRSICARTVQRMGTLRARRNRRGQISILSAR
ncbi:putative fructokinase [Geobacillus sp. BCO2]|nr:putative fructokinase [Geobacillus sp. BCO2]